MKQLNNKEDMDGRGKYNEYSISHIKKLIKIGQSMTEKCETEEALYNSVDCYFNEWPWICLGWHNPELVPEVKEFYRIGEPIVDNYNQYKCSYNFAENRPEEGVSVVTTAWLHSLKSVFFGTSDEKISRRGVYKITGFALPHRGGDDELLIVPLDWAVKTKIRTRAGLERAVKESENKPKTPKYSGPKL